MLLVDAERPVASSGPWGHLNAPPDSWVRPAGATDDQCHLMVQVMEFLVHRRQRRPGILLRPKFPTACSSTEL